MSVKNQENRRDRDGNTKETSPVRAATWERYFFWGGVDPKQSRQVDISDAHTD